MYLVSSDLNFENSFKTQRLLEAYDTLKVSKINFLKNMTAPSCCCSVVHTLKRKSKKQKKSNNFKFKYPVSK